MSIKESTFWHRCRKRSLRFTRHPSLHYCVVCSWHKPILCCYLLSLPLMPSEDSLGCPLQKLALRKHHFLAGLYSSWNSSTPMAAPWWCRPSPGHWPFITTPSSGLLYHHYFTISSLSLCSSLRATPLNHWETSILLSISTMVLLASSPGWPPSFQFPNILSHYNQRETWKNWYLLRWCFQFSYGLPKLLG